ncbi:MAG: hypothetical protein ACFB0Z_00875 [Candidatus Phaeomarinobacter sp.]
MRQAFAALFLTMGLLVAQPSFASEHYICVTNNDATSTASADVRVRFCKSNSEGCSNWQEQSIAHGDTFLFQSFGHSTRIVEVDAQSGGLSNGEPVSAQITRRPKYYAKNDFLTQAVNNKAGMCERGASRFCGTKFVGSNGRC